MSDYDFKIELDLLGKYYNKDTIFIQTINSHADFNIDNLIKCFTSVFCEWDSAVENSPFIVKRQFKYLELMVPELLPYIYFINKNKHLYQNITCNHGLFEKIKRFSSCLLRWVNEYYKIFNDEFITKNTGDMSLIGFLEMLDMYQRLLFSHFKEILFDFLNLLNADNDLIKNYRFLIKLHDYEIIKERYRFNLDLHFFVYFILAAGSESKAYMKRFNKHNHIVDNKLVTDSEMKKVIHSIYFIHNSEILKSSICEYETMIPKFGMRLFNIQDHLDGFLGFENVRFSGFVLFYDLSDEMKYRKRINFYEVWKLLYLNFLSNLFEE